jgi:hypothetical protein
MLALASLLSLGVAACEAEVDDDDAPGVANGEVEDDD